MLTKEDTKTEKQEKIKPWSNNGDHEKFSHYVDKNAIIPSAVEGTPVQALCGKIWVPMGDPERYPICPTCKEIYDSLPQ